MRSRAKFWDPKAVLLQMGWGRREELLPFASRASRSDGGASEKGGLAVSSQINAALNDLQNCLCFQTIDVGGPCPLPTTPYHPMGTGQKVIDGKACKASWTGVRSSRLGQPQPLRHTGTEGRFFDNVTQALVILGSGRPCELQNLHLTRIGSHKKSISGG